MAWKIGCKGAVGAAASALFIMPNPPPCCPPRLNVGAVEACPKAEGVDAAAPKLPNPPKPAAAAGLEAAPKDPKPPAVLPKALLVDPKAGVLDEPKAGVAPVALPKPPKDGVEEAEPNAGVLDVLLNAGVVLVPNVPEAPKLEVFDAAPKAGAAFVLPKAGVVFVLPNAGVLEVPKDGVADEPNAEVVDELPNAGAELLEPNDGTAVVVELNGGALDPKALPNDGVLDAPNTGAAVPALLPNEGVELEPAAWPPKLNDGAAVDPNISKLSFMESTRKNPFIKARSCFWRSRYHTLTARHLMNASLVICLVLHA